MTSLFRPYVSRLVALLLLVTLASCSEDSTGPDTKKPLLSGPGTINFGNTSVGLCKDTTIRYDNTTGKAITLSSVTIEGGGFTWIGSPTPVEVAAGASIDVKLRFCPVTEDTSKATVVFKGAGGEDVKLTVTGFASGRALTVGSMFTFATFLTTGTGVKQPGTDGIEVHTITGVNRTFAGKTGVTSAATGITEDYFALEANGNISTFLPTDVPIVGGLIGGWRELPFGTKLQNVVLLDRDTSIETPQFPGIPIPVNIKQVASYTGTSSVQVEGVTHTVENVTLVTTVKPSLPLGTLTVTVKLGYINGIGYLGTYNSSTKSTISAVPLDEGISKTLTSFEIN